MGLSQCFCQIVSEQLFFAQNQRTPTAVIEKNEKENFSSFCDFFELSFCFICFVWKSVVNIYIKYYRNILIIVKKKNLPLISHTVIYFFMEYVYIQTEVIAAIIITLVIPFPHLYNILIKPFRYLVKTVSSSCKKYMFL